MNVTENQGVRQPAHKNVNEPHREANHEAKRGSELTNSTIVIRRLGCRDEATKRIYRAVILVSIDNTGFVNMSGVNDLEFYDNMRLLRLIADARNVGDNVTLEEILYFVEMGRMTVIIDDEPYPWKDIKEIILDMNKETIGQKNAKSDHDETSLQDIVDAPVLGLDNPSLYEDYVSEQTARHEEYVEQAAKETT